MESRASILEADADRVPAQSRLSAPLAKTAWDVMLLAALVFSGKIDLNVL